MRLTYDQVIQKCREYADKVDKKEIQRAQWEHFVGWIYEDPDELEQILSEYNDEMKRRRKAAKAAKSGKGKGKADADAEKGKGKEAQRAQGAQDAKRMECGAELKRLSNFIQGQLATSPYWGGSMAAKSIFLLKQGNTGRGMKDKQEVENSGQMEVTVAFGGGIEEPFG